MVSHSAVVPFRMNVFRDYPEFEHYLRASDAQRGARWLHERSLASPGETVTLQGTCGLCLQPTRFTASTRGGEAVPGGRVPNWREGLACSCEHRLISRERALLHYLLAATVLSSWTRVLAMGDLVALHPVLSGLVSHLDCLPGPLDTAATSGVLPRRGYHLILSVEQLTSQVARPDILAGLAGLLAPGGMIVFTAPFIIDPPTKACSEGDILARKAVGWEVLYALSSAGFTAARACTFWSEELGYLGAFNVIVAANKS